MAVVSLLLLSMVAVPVAFAQGPSPSNSSYPNTSWALGVVVPEGSGLQDGGKVQWGSVTNVTAEVVLPNITSPDRNIYAVISVMTEDGSVLQAAAGALPNRSVWLSFAWFIPDVNSAQLNYDWILNASGPQIAPRSNIVVSIFHASGSWNLRVADLDSGQAVVQRFPEGISPALRSGDQEVFALESYSKAGSTFQDMGNLTLSALLLDGTRVVSGFYSYSQWDPNHSPLFAVGSSGATLPSFIYLGEGPEGSFFWDYASVWPTTGGTAAGLFQILAVGLSTAAIALVGAAAWLAVSRKNSRKVTGGG